MAGLQGIRPTVPGVKVTRVTEAPRLRAAKAASSPAWPPPITRTGGADEWVAIMAAKLHDLGRETTRDVPRGTETDRPEGFLGDARVAAGTCEMPPTDRTARALPEGMFHVKRRPLLFRE